jgi:hypothetical protein
VRIDRDRGRLATPPTGSLEAVARLQFPQNVACGFPALRSSAGVSQHCKSLQLRICSTGTASPKCGCILIHGSASELYEQGVAGNGRTRRKLTVSKAVRIPLEEVAAFANAPPSQPQLAESRYRTNDACQDRPSQLRPAGACRPAAARIAEVGRDRGIGMRDRVRSHRAVFILLAMALSASSPPAWAAELKVLAPNAGKEALSEIASHFEQESGSVSPTARVEDQVHDRVPRRAGAPSTAAIAFRD